MSLQKFSYSARTSVERTHMIEGKIINVEVTEVKVKDNTVPQYKLQLETTEGTLNVRALKGTIKGPTVPQLMMGGFATLQGSVTTLKDAQGAEYQVFNTLDCNIKPSKIAQLAASGVAIQVTADLFS